MIRLTEKMGSCFASYMLRTNYMTQYTDTPVIVY